jgi:hypothetical protein
LQGSANQGRRSEGQCPSDKARSRYASRTENYGCCCNRDYPDCSSDQDSTRALTGRQFRVEYEIDGSLRHACSDSHAANRCERSCSGWPETSHRFVEIND